MLELGKLEQIIKTERRGNYGNLSTHSSTKLKERKKYLYNELNR